MKHVEVDYHFVDYVINKLHNVRFISTNDQVADGFTKALPQRRLLEFRCNLNLIKMQLREVVGIDIQYMSSCVTRKPNHSR
jgi:hypothetical protein